MKIISSDTLAGKIDKIIFQNPVNGYTVIQLQSKEAPHAKIMVVGHLGNIPLGVQATFQGRWQDHPTHGKQFLAEQVDFQSVVDPEHIAEQILKKQLEGIGASFAQKLWQKFGSDLPEILEHTPQRVKEISGIGKQRYEKILSSWQKYRDAYEPLTFLLSHHVSIHLAIRIYEKYQKNTLSFVQHDPYRLMFDIEGIGFSTADAIAQALDVSPHDPRRIQAGIEHSIVQATQYGHCGVGYEKFISQVAYLLQVSADEVIEAIQQLIQKKRVIADSVNDIPCVFPYELYHQELTIAKQILSLVKTFDNAKTKRLQQHLNEAISHDNMEFSEEQMLAMERAIQEQFFVITGGPGVGKTTIVKWLVKIFSSVNLLVALTAPTGRAAKRLTEVTSVEAKTIHRLLEYDPYTKQFRYHENNLLPFEVVIVDEASMIDVPLYAALLSAISPRCQVIMVGDVDQLASVGPGDVLRSLLQSDKVPCQRLHTIFRQKETSQIIVNAHRVNQGLMPKIEDDKQQDFYWVNATSEDNQQNKLLKMITERIPERFGIDWRHIQVLSPTNEGPLGVNQLNRLLQRALNPHDMTKAEVKHRDRIFREGDKVIQVVNDYEKNIFNGDLGEVCSVDPETNTMIVLFDSQPLVYSSKEWDKLKLAYAITIHKSQGSEYPAVIVLLSIRQKRMLTRNLLYTAISRGKSCVVCLCDEASLTQAIQTQTTAKRMNKLAEWLAHESK